MTGWAQVQDAVRTALQKLRRTPVLDAVAKGALRQVPVVGDILVDVYESAGGSEEAKTEKLAAVLRRVETFQAGQFEALSRQLETDRDRLRRDVAALDTILDTTERIERRLDRLQESTDDIFRLLVDVDAELEFVAQGAYVFDPGVTADRLSFLLQLRRLLDMTRRIFARQDALARRLLARMAYRPRAQSVDDALREGFEHIPAEDRPLVAELRRITDHVSQVNNRIRRLLGTNRSLFRQELAPLYRHLSMYLAKYELLKDDPHMCLVYVGVAQQSPFPSETEAFVRDQIVELREETLLDVERLDFPGRDPA